MISSKQGCTVPQWAKPRAARYDAGKVAALQVILLFSVFLRGSLTPLLPSATYLRATHGLSWGRHLPSTPTAKIPFYELPGRSSVVIPAKQCHWKTVTPFKRVKISVLTTKILLWSPHHPNVLFLLAKKSIPQYLLSCPKKNLGLPVDVHFLLHADGRISLACISQVFPS